MHPNMEYGRIDDDGVIEYAPKSVKLGGVINLHPTAEDYALLGYKPVVDEPPKVDNDAPYYAKATGWEELNGKIRRHYDTIPKPLPTVADFDMAMEEHLRTEREARGYTTREPDAYLESSNARWRQDAHDWGAHRDAVMSYALDLINDVESGEREPPTIEEFVAGLPNIVWTIE